MKLVYFFLYKKNPLQLFPGCSLTSTDGSADLYFVIIDILSRMFENLDSILSKPQGSFVFLSIFSFQVYISIIILGAIYDKMMTYLYRSSQVGN